MHFYNYGVKGWDWRTFPTPRFASEYGFESWCNLETLYDVSSAADRVPGSNFTEHRQHHTNGKCWGYHLPVEQVKSSQYHCITVYRGNICGILTLTMLMLLLSKAQYLREVDREWALVMNHQSRCLSLSDLDRITSPSQPVSKQCTDHVTNTTPGYSA